MKDSLILGKFTPTAPVQSEEMKACYQRITQLESTLNECRSYFEERADADCDQDGFIPNEEMTLMVEIDEVLL